MDRSNYPFRAIEQKWQHYWDTHQTFHFKNDPQKPKFYSLAMFMYPSGDVHIGHVRNYTLEDGVARFKRQKGFSVLHPMGWDAFGLPAENAAIAHKVHPGVWTERNIANMKRQLGMLGFSYDWTQEFKTCDPSYYKHQQRFFLEFLKHGLVKRVQSHVNWDPVEQTVLANEQVINGCGWRSGAVIEKRLLWQWSVRITAFADQLLEQLDTLEGWPEKVRVMQKQWIGRSEGAVITFRCADSDALIDVFTTKPEALFGMSFLAISADHPLVESLVQHKPELAAFVTKCRQTAVDQQTLDTQEKEGVDTGLRVIHPFRPHQTFPVYIANYVLSHFGTGAVYGSPADDARDRAFAERYQLAIPEIIQNPLADPEHHMFQNSDFLNGLVRSQARQTIIDRLASEGLGQARTLFRLRDWGVSRQRYWGCPIPVIHCDHCGVVPVPLKDLPVTLPEDVDITGSGNPLEAHPTWKHVPCPTCQRPAQRETDTLDTFFDSAWYFLRFCNAHAEEALDAEAIQRWMPVDQYVGGIEHAILHLLYARFFMLALRTCGYNVPVEPFTNLLTQGMVCHPTYQDPQGQWLSPRQVVRGQGSSYVTSEGLPVKVGRSEKMSKSKKNVVDPEQVIQDYGVDAVRLFIVSDTPPERDLDWSEEGLEGCWRFMNRLWKLAHTILDAETESQAPCEEARTKFLRCMHQTIRDVTDSLEHQHFNKMVAWVRAYVNTLQDLLPKLSYQDQRAGLKCLAQLAHPVIPHMTEEIWSLLGEKGLVLDAPWPEYDPQWTVQNALEIVVQVNGKRRGSISIEAQNNTAEHVQPQALALATVQKDLEGKQLQRAIFVPGRLINLVVGA